MPNELKPCPFCGGRAEILGHTKVGCTQCDANIHQPWMSVLSPIVAAWNRRAVSEEEMRELALKTVGTVIVSLDLGIPRETIEQKVQESLRSHFMGG